MNYAGAKIREVLADARAGCVGAELHDLHASQRILRLDVRGFGLANERRLGAFRNSFFQQAHLISELFVRSHRRSITSCRPIDSSHPGEYRIDPEPSSSHG